MLKVIELFGGIGAMTQALKRIGVDFQVVDYVEIDKYAVASYNAMNGTDYKPQDVTKWDKDIECDLIMHGSPCQDFSIAGLQKGGDRDSGTRSSLMWETVRIVNNLKPKYVIWENVKNVVSDVHWHNFEKYLNAMASMGYASAWKVLNAKDYGVPQNRERVFVVSVMNGRTVYETMNLFGDSEKKLDFEFPEPFPLTKKLKDILEKDVDEKYYLSNVAVSGFMKHNEKHKEKGTGFIWKPKTEDDVANTLRANASLCATDNTIMVSDGEKQIPVLMQDCGKTISRELDVAVTLMARDWKGVNNYGSNGVIVIDEQRTKSNEELLDRNRKENDN